MLPDISNKRCVIFGLQGSGKTVLAKNILRAVPACIVYDVHHEYYGFPRYLVDHKQVRSYKPDDPAIAELNLMVTRIVLGSGKIRLFVLDEANRYCPNHRPLPSSILTLNDDNRHDRIAFCSIARRPAQLHTDLVELAHYIFIFRLPGLNDFKWCEEIAQGLGEAVRNLKDFHFMIVDQSRKFQEHEPVKDESQPNHHVADSFQQLKNSKLIR